MTQFLILVLRQNSVAQSIYGFLRQLVQFRNYNMRPTNIRMSTKCKVQIFFSYHLSPF